MSISDLILCLFILVVCIFGCREVSAQCYPLEFSINPNKYNIKKIKLKHFWFLFNEGSGLNYKTREVSLCVIVFVSVGYIVNLSALIATIICYCLDIYIVKWIYVLLAVNFIAWSIYAICIALYNRHR